MTDLKPCPFCGGEATIFPYLELGNLHMVKCRNCNISRVGKSEGEAVKEWNNRPSNWHTGTPTDVGWFLVKYECVCEGRYKGRIGYRAVRRKKDPIDGYIYEDGAINAEDVWKPIEWQKIESFKEEDNGKE